MVREKKENLKRLVLALYGVRKKNRDNAVFDMLQAMSHKPVD